MKSNWRVLLIIVGVVAVLSGVVALSVRKVHDSRTPSMGPGITLDMTALQQHANLVPTVVIGSGPAGLSSALYTSRGGNFTVMFEGIEPGGQLTKTSYIENWPGQKKILGQELMEKFHEQVAEFPVKFIHEVITKVDVSEWPFTVTTEEGTELKALSLVMATGSTPLTLGIPGEKEYWGRGVTTCAICDAPFYEGKDVIVIGGGDSAAEEAIQLSAYAKNITVMVRKGEMRATAAMQKNMAAIPSIKVAYHKEVQEVLGNDDQVTHIKVYDNKTKTTKVEPMDGVFLAIGHKPNTELVHGQLAMDENNYIELVGRSQQTSVPGVFAAGDVADHHYKQAGKAAGDGIAAGIDANNFLADMGFNSEVARELAAQMYGAAPAPTVQATVADVKSIADFDKLINEGDLPVVVEFVEADCPECSSMKDIVREIVPNYAGKLMFAMIDINTVPDLAEQLIILKTPTTLVYKDGSLLARYQSAMNKSTMENFLNQFIKQ